MRIAKKTNNANETAQKTFVVYEEGVNNHKFGVNFKTYLHLYLNLNLWKRGVIIIFRFVMDLLFPSQIIVNSKMGVVK